MDTLRYLNIRSLLAVLLVLICCSLYWVSLLKTQEEQLAYAGNETRLRADQMSAAVTSQVSTLFAGLEYMMYTLSRQYTSTPAAGFSQAVKSALTSFPDGSIIQIAVADAQGRVTYSNLNDTVFQQAIYINDREHFLAHLNPDGKQPATRKIYIGQPVLGRVSQQWTIQISYPLENNNAFSGVLIVSINPSYISDYFRIAFPDPRDVSLLLRTDGSYLARSEQQTETLTRQVPADREFLLQPNLLSGSYHVVSPVDGIERYYTWNRIQKYQLIVSVGLAHNTEQITSLKNQIQDVRVRSLIGTLLLLAATIWIAFLFARINQGKHLREALFSNNPTGIFLVNPHQRVVKLSNQKAAAIFSGEDKMLDGRHLKTIHRDEESYQKFSEFYKIIRQKGAIHIEHQLRDAEGELRWFSLFGNLLYQDDANSDVVWSMLDISKRKEAENNLRMAQSRLTTVIQHFPGGILVTNEEGEVLIANQELCRLFNLNVLPDELVGQPYQQLTGQLPDSIRHHLGQLLTQQTVRIALEDGRTMEVSFIPVNNVTNIGSLFIVLDVTEHLQHEQALQHLANTDPLTDLANRRTFMERLQRELIKANKQHDYCGFLMILDLDHFKNINDTYGHAAGDEVLKFLADIFTQSLRKSDLPARLGGEEFSVLLPDTSVRQAFDIAERIRTTLENSHIPTPAGPVTITVSIGIARVADVPARTLQAADDALYKAKNNGRNQTVIAASASE